MYHLACLQGHNARTVAPLRVTPEVPMRARVCSCRGGGTLGKDYLLLIARPSLASCRCKRRGRCLEASRGTAARDSRPRSIIHRGIFGSSTHLSLRNHPPARGKKQERTEVPFPLNPCYLRQHRIRLFDHMFSPSPRPHGGRANRIFLIPTNLVARQIGRPRHTVELHLPYRSSSLNDFGAASFSL